MVDMTSSLLAATDASGITIVGAVMASSIIIAGASYGLSLIGSKAVESIARQPEAEGRIFMAMIIAAALVEGVTFFALLICFLTLFWMR
jgi:F-type H+-transporting ATPase subunit c